MASSQGRGGPLIAALVGVLVVSGCGSQQPQTGQFGTVTSSPIASATVTASPQPATTASPGAPIVVEASEFPTPRSTLRNAPAPPASPGVATLRPVARPQYVPPDLTESGIALTVSGTRFRPGQTVRTSSQAAPELAGFTAYLLASDPDGTVTPVATGQVDADGRFALAYQPSGPNRIVTAVAQAGITSTDAFSLDNLIARSELVRVRPV